MAKECFNNSEAGILTDMAACHQVTAWLVWAIVVVLHKVKVSGSKGI